MATGLEVVLKVIDQGTAPLTKFASSWEQMQSKVVKVAGALTGIFAGGAIVGGIMRMADESIRFGAAIKEMSEKTGLSISSVQELGYVAKMGGTSIEALQKGIKGFAISATASHKNITDLNGAFKEELIRIAELKSPTERLTEAQKSFGKSSMELMGIIGKGPEEIRKLYDETKKYGLILSDNVIKQMDDAADAQERMDLSMKVFSANMVVAFTPAIIGATEGIARLAKGWSDFWNLSYKDPNTKIVKDLNSDLLETQKIIDELQARKNASPMSVLGGMPLSQDEEKKLRSKIVELRLIKQDLEKATKDKSGGSTQGEDPAELKKAADARLKIHKAEQKAIFDATQLYDKREDDYVKEKWDAKQAELKLQLSVAKDIEEQGFADAEARFNLKEQAKRDAMQKTQDMIMMQANYAIAMGEALASGIGKGNEGLKQSGKAMLTTLLDIVEKTLLAGKIKAALDALITWNPVPLLQIAGISAAFAVAKGAISQFAQGGQSMGGMFLAGEHGPELISTRGPANITNASTTQRQLITNNNQKATNVYNITISRNLKNEFRDLMRSGDFGDIRSDLKRQLAI